MSADARIYAIYVRWRYLRDALVCYGAVIDVVHSPLELGETKVHAGTPRQHDVLAVFETALLGPVGGFPPPIARQVCAFREKQKPHRVKEILAVGAGMVRLEFLETMCETRAVDSHFARHEDESKKHTPGADNGDPP